VRVVMIRSKPMKVSEHALDKYMKITGCKFARRSQNSVLKMLGKAERVERLNSVKCIMKHRYNPGVYFKYFNWVFVVKEDTVVTCYFSDGNYSDGCGS